MDLLKTVNTLNRALSRKSKSGVRVDSANNSANKGSFLSLKESREMRLLHISSKNPSTSFQHQINLDYDDDDEDEIDERNPGNLVLTSVNTLSDSQTNGKRCVSEMQKSIAHKISISKPTHAIGSKGRDKYKNKNQAFTTLNGIKTVSLHELTGSTKSGGQSSARPVFKQGYNGLLSNSKVGLTQSNSEKPNLLLGSSLNNNSISSLKLNERQMHIDL